MNLYSLKIVLAYIMTLNDLENLYWQRENQLKDLAAQQGVSTPSLVRDIQQFEDSVRSQVEIILWEQVELLEKILPLKRSLLSSSSVVSLASYRALIS